MRLHASATTTIVMRRRIVRAIEDGSTITQAAQASGVSRKTASKWWHRFQEGGEAALLDRSTRPKTSPRRSSQRLERRVIKLRAAKWGVHRIAWRLKRSVSTVYWICRRYGLGSLQVLEPQKPPAIRYERDRPGELVHVDIKKLRRIGNQPGWRVTGRHAGYKTTGSGWDYIHVAIDDRTRLAFAMALPDETTNSCVRFIKAANTWYQRQGIRIERVMTDNGSGYKLRWRIALGLLGIQARYTRPYRPQTNGKAERMIQTLLREWAYNQPYQNNQERLSALPEYLDYYNNNRAHTALNGTSPHQRAENDLLKNDS